MEANMIQLSELIGKRVISLYNLKFEGTVVNVLLDSKRQRAKYLILQNDDDYIEKVISFKNIYHISNALCIKNDTCIRLKDEMELELLGYYNPMCAEIFDTSGSNMGVITDIALDDKYDIMQYTTQKYTFDKANVICFNSHMLLLKKDHEKLSQFGPSKKIVPTKETELVAHLPTEISPIEPIGEAVTTKTPHKVTINSSILLDRVITKNITTPNGVIIAKQNQKITLPIIQTARMYGKLKELTEYSVKA